MPSDLRIFIINLLRVTIFAAILLSLVFAGIRPDMDNYLAGSLYQIQLLEQTQGSRIILAGGSNVSFGLDAELMQRELGVSVINFGLHAGLGIVPLRELQQYVHEGDIVIISLEYSMFSSLEVMNGDPAFLSDWIEVLPSRVRYLSNPLFDIPSIYAVMLQRKINRSLEYTLNGGSLDKTRTIFNSRQFNANGDFIGHLQETSLDRQKIPFDPFPIAPLQDDFFSFLEDYEKTLHAMGVTVYFEAPASRQSNCDVTGEKNLAVFFDTIKTRSSITMLTPLDQVCMADKYFFDTPYHLNADGRRLRTQRLIGDLLKLLDLNN